MGRFGLVAVSHAKYSKGDNFLITKRIANTHEEIKENVVFYPNIHFLSEQKLNSPAAIASKQGMFASKYCVDSGSHAKSR